MDLDDIAIGAAKLRAELKDDLTKLRKACLLFPNWTLDEVKVMADLGDENAGQVVFFTEGLLQTEILIETQSTKRGMTPAEVREALNQHPADFWATDIQRSIEKLEI